MLEHRQPTKISTHTLRGERDQSAMECIDRLVISTHTLRGERDPHKFYYRCYLCKFQLTRSVGSVTRQRKQRKQRTKFQLTRSVGSVTLHIVYVKSHHHNRADILLKITLKSDIFLHNMYYIFSEPPYKTNITARSLTKSSCPQGHMFPLHLYAPLSSSNYYPNNRIEGYLVLHQ